MKPSSWRGPMAAVVIAGIAFGLGNGAIKVDSPFLAKLLPEQNLPHAEDKPVPITAEAIAAPAMATAPSTPLPASGHSFHDDPAVIQASATSLAVPLATALVGTNPVIVTAITDKNKFEFKNIDPDEAVTMTSNEFDIILNEAIPEDPPLVATLGTKTPIVATAVPPTDGKTKQWKFTIDNPGEWKIKNEDKTLATVDVPVVSNDLLKFTAISNNEYVPASAVGFDPAAAHEMYNRYLKLKIRTDRSVAGQFELHLVRGTNPPVFAGKGHISNLHLEGDQAACDVVFPDAHTDGQTYYLIAKGKMAGNNVFSPQLLEVKSLAPVDLSLTTFALARSDSDVTYTPRDGKFYTKASALNATTTFSGQGGWTNSLEKQLQLVLFYLNPTTKAIIKSKNVSSAPTAFVAEIAEDGDYLLSAAFVCGNFRGPLATPIAISRLTTPPKVIRVEPENFQFNPLETKIVVTFDEEHPLKGEDFNSTKENYVTIGKIGGDLVTLKSIAYDQSKNALVIELGAPLTPGKYQLTLKSGITDLHGVALKEVTKELIQPGAGTVVGEGLPSTSGPFVRFHEYTKPRSQPEGFNPADRVETRVARLYYYRDAHRVAQIINRNARSWNRQGADMARQQADKARTLADHATVKRRRLEQTAVEAAQRARQSERAIEAAQQRLAEAQAAKGPLQLRAAQLQESIAEASGAEAEKLQSQLTTVNADLKIAEDRANAAVETFRQASASIEADREAEVRERAAAAEAQEEEDLLRAEQFQREVAAAKADPDTYAPGKPNSFDPVEQVSVSVIGEGVIQLRGPLKGINIIRLMINQIDSPCGQVRIGVHTAQINGEHGDRMEPVAKRIQDSIDHSRFMTMQTAQMLRKAIVSVAARRADETLVSCPDSQEARDEKYLKAYFGKDFIDELRAVDSEFLMTGNKLLSLHSMDSTSLASALFLMALAKNDTRLEILETFDAMLQGELMAAEDAFMDSSGCCGNWKCKKICLLAPNAHFQSLKGFFDVQVANSDTMTPIQREFVRLAQIFKSQLVAEMGIRQRVMERSLIEQREGDSAKVNREALEKEAKAAKALDEAVRSVIEARADVKSAIGAMMASISVLRSDHSDSNSYMNLWSELAERRHATADEEKRIRWSLEYLEKNFEMLGKFIYTGKEKIKFDELQRLHTEIHDNVVKDGTYDLASALATAESIARYYRIANELRDHAFRKFDEGIRLIQGIEEKLVAEEVDVQEILRNFYEFDSLIQRHIGRQLRRENEAVLSKFREALDRLSTSFTKYAAAEEEAKRARRPVDHRKLLDMLVDEAEDRYIEILEGVRSHTANVDAYLKMLVTALDDDFNRQFYYPSFCEIRKASRAWDVTLSQIETTTVLTNNRTFAKVEPQATMEFDLPKRDIMVVEAMQGAKAMIQDYGALVNDPSFLALTKLRSGQPTSTMAFGTGDSLSRVRDVLPTLPGQTDEQILSQVGPGDRELGAAMEALIPDPSIYKFETGTGFEIKPVIQPDGQAVVFHFNYMYTTKVREPVRADEKHLGRVKRHYIDTDVQLGNFELREVSRYQVALKAARTSRGVPLLEDAPIVGALFRPLPSDESSLQENIVLAQATIFPTLFDLMGLRFAPAIAELNPLGLATDEFVTRARKRDLSNHVFDISSEKVDESLRIPPAARRTDLYRTQETIPSVHPNGYQGPGLNVRDSHLEEGYDPRSAFPPSETIRGIGPEAIDRSAPVEHEFQSPGTMIEPNTHHETGGELPMPAVPHSSILSKPGSATAVHAPVPANDRPATTTKLAAKKRGWTIPWKHSATKRMHAN